MKFFSVDFQRVIAGKIPDAAMERLPENGYRAFWVCFLKNRLKTESTAAMAVCKETSRIFPTESTSPRTPKKCAAGEIPL